MKNTGLGSKVFDGVNIILLSLFSLLSFIPFLYVVITSFSTSTTLIPSGFSMEAYRYIFSANTFTRSLEVSILITVVGTLFQLIMTSLMAYSLSHRHLPGRNGVLLMVLFTMLFSGGMIPTYFVVKSTGLLDSLAALVIPSAISAFNLIILKNFFQGIPEELKESAKIDGSHELGLLFRIILPLSLPAMATFGLFYAVGIWNQYFNAILYLTDATKYPVQVILRQVIILTSGSIGDTSEFENMTYYGNSIKMAVIVIATIPIMLVYPFLQKHFAKGVLLGSVKG